MDRPTKPSGRHAVRLRWDEIITRLSFRFNFLAIRDCGRLTDLKWPKSYVRCRICGGGGLAEIRQQAGCHNVQDIAINRVTDERAENNWSLCVLSAGAADANTAARAALYVQGVLRRDYNLMTD